MGARFNDIEQGDPLARTRRAPVAVLLGIGEPFLGAFPARVPLDQVVGPGGVLVALVVGLDHGDVLDGVIAAVQTQQQRCRGQLPRAPQHALQKLRRAFLAMLTAFTQLQLQAVALLSQIGGHGRVTVLALIGARDSFLFRLGVVERRDIAIERHQPVVQRREPRTAAAQKLDGRFLHRPPCSRAALASMR